MVGGKKTGVIQAAKRLAREGKEVTYPAMVTACYVSSKNTYTIRAPVWMANLRKHSLLSVTDRSEFSL